MPLYRMAKELVLPKGEKAILTELCDHMNDNTELHSVSSPSGMVQHKPPEKPQYITTSSSEEKVADGAVPTLSKKQLTYAKKLALQYYEKYKDEFYNFDSLFEGTKVFFASKQTEEDWRKIGNGLPSPKHMGWL